MLDKCYFVRVLLTDSTGTKHVPKVFIHDFLKKLVSDDCLAALFLTSAQVFLIIFFAGEGCFSFSVGLILWGSPSLASVESVSQTFSVTAKQTNHNLYLWCSKYCFISSFWRVDLWQSILQESWHKDIFRQTDRQKKNKGVSF